MGIEVGVAGRNAAELLQLPDQPLDSVKSPIGLAIEIGVGRRGSG